MRSIIYLVLRYCLLLALVPILFAENGPGSPDRSAAIPRIQQPPTLEDFLTMEPSPRIAGKMARIEGFRQWTPHDGQPVSQRTIAYLAYDDKNFYAVFVCLITSRARNGLTLVNLTKSGTKTLWNIGMVGF